MSLVKVTSTAHNDCYLGRLAESLQQLKQLNIDRAIAIVIHE